MLFLLPSCLAPYCLVCYDANSFHHLEMGCSAMIGWSPWNTKEWSLHSWVFLSATQKHIINWLWKKRYLRRLSTSTWSNFTDHKMQLHHPCPLQASLDIGRIPCGPKQSQGLLCSVLIGQFGVLCHPYVHHFVLMTSLQDSEHVIHSPLTPRSPPPRIRCYTLYIVDAQWMFADLKTSEIKPNMNKVTDV